MAHHMNCSVGVPKISVIIPVYNGVDYISQAINSALVQTETEIEVIVVNDGSTDETGKAVLEINDRRIRLINQANAGVSAARNAGIDASSGEWLAFLDADDVWFPSKLAIQSQWFERADIVAGNAKILGSQTNLLPRGKLDDLNLRQIYHLLEGGTPPLSSVCVRRSAVRENRFDDSLKFGEDLEFWLRLVAQGATLYASDEPVYEYRVHSMSATSITNEPTLLLARLLRQFGTMETLPRRIRRAAHKSAGRNYCSSVRIALTEHPITVGRLLQFLWNGTLFHANPARIVCIAMQHSYRRKTL